MKLKNTSTHSVILFFIAFMTALLPTRAMAIVNMDSLHFDQFKETFSADLDFTLSSSSGNSESSKVALNTQLSWQAKKSINLAILSYEQGKSNNVRNVNKAFIHYRFIYQLDDTTDLELFSQLENNEFTRLSYRALLGAGLRFGVANNPDHSAFLGAGAFYSKEKTEYTVALTDDGIEDLTRANLYYLSKYKVKPNISFTTGIYYQPRLSEFSDFRALLKMKLDLKLTEKLSFRLKLDVEHDSAPSQTIKTTDISYMTGLKFSF